MFKEKMILAVDVQYCANMGFAGGVLFEKWTSQVAQGEVSCGPIEVADYTPGEFYVRELPCILALLKEHELQPHTIVIDGHVYLDGVEEPGLGKRLHDALGGEVWIVGVAKKPFVRTPDNCRVYRGESGNPLYVTSTQDLDVAKSQVESMHGKYRLPEMIKRADQWCREVANHWQSQHSQPNP
ncbi:MAG: endonuclease V [Gammaproteobacteria bacterium]